MAQSTDDSRFRAVVNTAVDGVILIDARATVLVFNPACERLFGYQAHEVIGQNVKILMPEPFHGEHDRYIGNYHRTGDRKIIGIGREVVGKRKDGTTFPMHLSVGEARQDGERYFVGIIHDLTEQKQAARRVRELTAELVHTSRLSAMGQLSSSLAHELNQPLTAVMNYTEAARQMLSASGVKVPPRVSEFMEKAAGQAERAGQIIRRLRSFVEKGAVERTPEHLNRIVEEASGLATTGATIDGIQVRLEMAANLPQIRIDKIQVQQVVVNLARNAVEILRQADRRVLTIRTAATETGDQEVSVADTGPGIAPEVADQLFKPFVSTKKDGMGIGLSISRSIIEAHGGRLWAEPNPGGGALFRFTLPAVGTEVELLSVAARIYVVDDDEAVRDSLQALLESKGHTVVAYDTAEAFLAGYHRGTPGCAIVDVRMPGMDGLTLLEKLRADGGRLPVIVVTGHGDVPLAVRAMKAGAIDFVEKPYTNDAIMDVVRRALELAGRGGIDNVIAADVAARVATLTPRERDVLEQLVVGQPNKIIAHELKISPRTVEIHRANLMKKMQADSLSHLVRQALAAGIGAKTR